MTSSYTILLLFQVEIHSIIFVSQDLVVLYIKDMLHSEPLLHLTNSGFTDSVWAPIKSKGGTSIIGVCYKSTSSTDPNNVKLLQLLEEATQQPHRHILILWNFNYPSIEYSKLIVNPGGEQAAKDFLDKTMDILCTRMSMRTLGFDEVKTRVNSIISLQTRTIWLRICTLQVLLPLEKSDHACFDFSYLKRSEDDQPNYVKRNYWKADYHRGRKRKWNY